MAYRNGTYAAFHAQGTSDPTKSDIKYFNLMKAWNASVNFNFINSHDKVASVRDSSKRETLRTSLVTRLRNSKNLVLLTSSTTKNDTDWVPFEISYAVDTCKLPIIAAYVEHSHPVVDPSGFRWLWPAALQQRIDNGSAHAIHIPFARDPLASAISQFSVANYPRSAGLGRYSNEAYRGWGLL